MPYEVQVILLALAAVLSGQVPHGLQLLQLGFVLWLRTDSQDVVVGTFGQKGRSDKSSIISQAAIDKIASRHSAHERAYWTRTLADTEKIKSEYKSKIITQKRRLKL